MKGILTDIKKLFFFDFRSMTFCLFFQARSSYYKKLIVYPFSRRLVFGNFKAPAFLYSEWVRKRISFNIKTVKLFSSI